MQLSMVISSVVLTGLVTWKMNWLPVAIRSQFTLRYLRLFWIAKMCIAFFYLFIYSSVYTKRKEIDTFKFFDDSRILSQATLSDPMNGILFFFGGRTSDTFQKRTEKNLSFWNRSYEDGIFNDNRLIIRINWLLHGISFGNYGIHLVIFNLFTFIGLLYLLAGLVHLGIPKYPSTYAVALIPSVLFWASGVTKEPLVLILLGLFIFYFSKWVIEKKSGLQILVLAALLIFLKPYIFACLLPPLAGYFLYEKQQKSFLTYIYSILFFLLITLIVHFVLPSFSPIVKLLNKQHEFIRFVDQINFGSNYTFYPSYSLFELVIKLPIYCLNGFTKPWPQETINFLQFAGMLENLFISSLFISAILLRIWYRIALRNIDVLCIVFCILLFTFLGITTPNYGALLRYKTPALPFLVAFSFSTLHQIYIQKQKTLMS